MASLLVVTNLPAGSLWIASHGFERTAAPELSAVFSPALMFFAMRPTSAVHSGLSRIPTYAVSNRPVLQDNPTFLYTTLVASGVFSLVLYISHLTWLPAYLSANLKGFSFPIDVAYALPKLFGALLVPGWMLRDFLFVSSTGAPIPAIHEPSDREYLITTVYRYTWGALSAKTKVLVTRTVFLATMIVLTTVVQLVSTVKDVSIEGAAGWGAVWASSTLLVGLVFGWIEGAEGV